MNRPNAKNYPTKEALMLAMDIYIDALLDDITDLNENLLNAGWEIDNLNRTTCDNFGDEWSKG